MNSVIPELGMTMPEAKSMFFKRLEELMEKKNLTPEEMDMRCRFKDVGFLGWKEVAEKPAERMRGDFFLRVVNTFGTPIEKVLKEEIMWKIRTFVDNEIKLNPSDNIAMSPAGADFNWGPLSAQDRKKAQTLARILRSMN